MALIPFSSVFILFQYRQMVMSHSLPLSFLLLYVSDCWHNFSSISWKISAFNFLSFSPGFVPQSHKRK